MGTISVTRIYKVKATGEIKTQPITIVVGAGTTVRPSNRLGYPEHRSTLTTSAGAELDLAEKYSEVAGMLEDVA